ncbi:MAG: hypothetical protein M5R40_26490 [Anaerolineae bacterium]|nr:hypothetical protein [Anaerolineae bacterium]
MFQLLLALCDLVVRVEVPRRLRMVSDTSQADLVGDIQQAGGSGITSALTRDTRIPEHFSQPLVL